MSSALHEIRYAVRAVLRTPGQSALAVLALGLGIGLTATAFSVVYGTAIKGLPFEGSERLMVLDRRALTGAGDRSDGIPNRVHQLADWRARQRSFEGLAAFATTGMNLSSAGGVPERLAGAYVTPDTFDLLRMRPQLGRGFEPDDGHAGRPQVAVIGYTLWQNRFGGVADIVGRTVHINGALTTIVGVMPRVFAFPLNQSIWMPLDVDAAQTPRGQGRVITVFGRLSDGASIGSARAEFAVLTRELAVSVPADYTRTTVLIRSYWRRFLGPDSAVAGLYAMMLGVFGVLLVACANVANLLLARAIVRTRELALRVALGATRAQVVAQVLAESAVIAVAGGGLGVALAWLGIDAFRRTAVDTHPPFWMEFSLNGPVLAFVVAMVAVSASFFEAFGVRPVEGRGFLASDGPTTQPVAIVNRRFVERHMAGGQATGRRIRLIDPTVPEQPWRLIVGVVPDMLVGRDTVDRDWGVYVPLTQTPPRGISIILRAAGDPRQLTPWVRRTVASLDPGLPVGSMATMRDVMFGAFWPTFLFGSLFASFGVVSLVLSVVGLYGVVAFLTGRRAHEIAIRVALGAAPARIVALILRQGVWQLVIGSAVGLAGGFALSGVFVRLDPGMRVFDPGPHGLVLGVLAAATLVAYLVPAKRATRSDPASVLTRS